MPAASAFRGTDENWVVSVNEIEGPPNKYPVAIHFVVDNSASMGGMTKGVKDIFSSMVDSVATAPCSLTLFSTGAKMVSSNITSTQEMLDMSLHGAQGCTNIPVGIEKALRVVYGCEVKAKINKSPQTHHVLVLLSDGVHNAGPTPERVFPTLHKAIPENTKLSVVVVGYSQNSSTSMGMLLKNSIETVSFKSDIVETIYFATSKQELVRALKSLEVGLNKALQGSTHSIETANGKPLLIEDLAAPPTSTIQLHRDPESDRVTFLYTCNEPPREILFDKTLLTVRTLDGINVDHLSVLVQRLIDNTKVRAVASSARSRQVLSKSVRQLDTLVRMVEAEASKEGATALVLRSASSQDRVRQYRRIKRLCNGARFLRNQLIDMANFGESGQGSSEAQARFLNGRNMKYATKAMRRAAVRSGDPVMDPKAERKAIRKVLTDNGFKTKLEEAMRLDTLDNIVRLTDEQFQSVLIPLIRSTKGAHVELVIEIYHKAKKHHRKEENDSVSNLELSPQAAQFLARGQLWEYLNTAFHGGRQSYLSLSTPWQHVEEWLHFESQKFESVWEMLMYAGLVGHPVQLDRSAASQMDPYQARVTRLLPSLVDTASLCCANQAEIKVYGPEAGENIQDVLVLIDPSMPRSTSTLYNSQLIGEKFTSVTISRDLNMYFGVDMKLALHGNSLLHILTSPERVVQEDIVANLRRQFLGRAYMCPMCGFGPVDHMACSNLMTHNGEQTRRGGTVDNSCPRCSWFSASLNDWKKWDGTVWEEMLESGNENNNKRVSWSISTTRLDVLLRILYSFRKLCKGETREQFRSMVQRAGEGDHSLSTKDGVAALSQVLMATMAFCCDDTNDDDSSDDPLSFGSVSSESFFLSLLQEHCQREMKKRYRMVAGGDKEAAKAASIEKMTRVLTIDKETAPYPLSLMESEPPVENVRAECDETYEVDGELKEEEVAWVKEEAEKWCLAWSYAMELRKIVGERNGGWKRIEEDMETGVMNYQDILASLKKTTVKSASELLGVEDCDMESFYLQIAVRSTLDGAGALKVPCMPRLYQNNLCDIAIELRMLVYLERVAEKMLQWREAGQDLVFAKARLGDIVQFASLFQGQRHVHGLDKPSFWGLWHAALRGGDKEKLRLFLETANEEFRRKHAPS